MATPPKILKLDDDFDNTKNPTSKETNNSNEAKDLTTFKFEKVLSNNTLRKSICLKGTFENIEGYAIVVLSQTPFEEELFKDTSYFSDGNPEVTFENDSYGNFKFFPVSKFNG